MFDFLFNEKQLSFRQDIRDFVKSIPRQMIIDMDQDKIRFPKEFLQEAGRRNLLGCRCPEKWGGRGMDWVSSCMAMEEIGILGYIFACVFGVGGELVCDALNKHGTKYQKERYVKPLLAGKIFAAECLTEPRGGSDFFGTTSTAVSKNNGEYFLLNGQKRFIVGAEGADFFLVYARTNSQAIAHKSLTCFIVDRQPGVKVEYLYGLMGCRGGGVGRLLFEDVKIPSENVVGNIDDAYRVFETMMIPERLGTSAMSIGAARPALEIASKYTMKRKAFGKTINEFQGVSFQVSEAVMLLDVSRAMCYSTGLAVDMEARKEKIRLMISETKKFVTESCQKVVKNAMQVMGGIGYTNIYPIEKIVRDLGLASIWTGTNEIMNLLISHEWYKKLNFLTNKKEVRNIENDALESEMAEEKIF